MKASVCINSIIVSSVVLCLVMFLSHRMTVYILCVSVIRPEDRREWYSEDYYSSPNKDMKA